MSNLAEPAELFESGTLAGLRMRLASAGDSEAAILKFACATILFGWIPLVLLSGFEGSAPYQVGVRSFLSDIAVSCRSLVAAPLLIIAQQVCLPRLTEIARNFRASGLVPSRDVPRFERAWSSTLKWCRFLPAWAGIVGLSYAIVIALNFSVPTTALPSWYVAPAGDGSHSLAGRWHDLVSLPLLLILIIGWLWRVFLWTRFLSLVARLDLRLVPAHPDQTAGLRFLGYSAQSFSLVALAFGFIVAGSAANRILYRGAEIASLKSTLFVLIALSVILFAGPLGVFSPHLLRAWRRGVLEYGALAVKLGHRFEEKWLREATKVDPSALEVEDFSATTDLYQVVSNVYEVRLFPAGFMSLGILVGMSVIPFFVIALMFVPVDVIVQELVELAR